MIRLYYVANSRIPTEKAHGLEIFKLCEVLADYFEVTLIVPRRFNKIIDDPFNYYRTKRKFKIIQLPVLDTIPLNFLGSFAFWIETVSFSIMVFFFGLFRTHHGDIFFSHENAPLFAASFLRSAYYDIHDFPVRGIPFYRLLINRCKGIITTNEWKRERLIKLFKIPADRIIVQPNGVEVEEFNIKATKEEARKKLALPLESKIILYTGQLFSWKGVDTLLQAAPHVPSCRIHIVGGVEPDLSKYKSKYRGYSTVIFHGHRHHPEIPLWLKAADVLVLPNTAKENISKYFTSPMKLFEYMASGTPIIASDIPSVRYIANSDEVLFFEADNSVDLAEKIMFSFNHSDLMRMKAVQAVKKSKAYTWRARAQAINKHIRKHT